MSNRLYYTPAASSKEKYETVRRDAAIIFNDCAVNYEHDKSLMFMPDAGEITFIDNNKDSYADVIIIKSYVYYISGIINKETPVLHDKAGIQPDIELDGDGVVITKDGAAISPSDIVSDQLLMAAASRVVYKSINGVTFMYADADSDKISIEVIQAERGGRIKKYSEGDGTVQLENDTLKISKVLEKAAEAFPDNRNTKIAGVNSSVSAKTDKYGQIAFFDVLSSGGSLEYVVIKKIYQSEDDDAYYALIFNQAGKHVAVKLADNLNVYKWWNTNEKLSTASYSKRRMTAAEVSRLDGERFSRRLVKCSFNADGELLNIYTAAVLPTDSFGKTLDYYVDDNVFIQGYSTVGQEYVLAWYRIAAWFTNSKTTVHFYMPSAEDGSDSDYSVRVGGSANEDFKRTECYDISEAGEIKCEVHYKDASSATGTFEKGKPMIITRAPHEVWDNEKEELVYSMEVYTTQKNAKGIYEAAFTEYMFSQRDLVSLDAYHDTYHDTSRRIPYPEKSGIPITALKIGDFISASVDSDTGRINSFAYFDGDVKELYENGESQFGVYKPMFSANALCWTEWSEDQNPLNELYIKGQVIKNLDDTYFYIKTNQESIRRAELKKAAYSTDIVCLYSVSKNEITELSFGDIREGDYIIVHGGAYAMVVRN